jgi:riboflavin kinase / FMN adenylyltransferase
MDTYFGFPAERFEQPVFLTIGNFDGVHRGHQMLVCELASVAHAAGGLAGLLTFEPHPLAVLRPQVRVPRLTSNEERAELLAALGLDFVLVIPFTRETANTTAADFMSSVGAHLPLAELWIGPDFALGKGREGNAARLAELGRGLGYRVHVAPPYDLEGEPVRSSRVRSLLIDEGAVERAAAYLGRPYRVWGEVVKGAQRGRTIGFPTANLALPAERLVPAFGVYACWAWLEDRGYPAVVNIGVRPSFDNGQPSVEAYLLDFDADLYSQTVGLSFIRRLRGEQKFENIAALVAQIHADAEAGRAILADPPTHADPPEAHAWEEITHTADWAIRVRGAGPTSLFANAALAMYTLQDADAGRAITLGRAVNASADGLPGLLITWLNRLLLCQELGGEMYTRFEVQEISDRGIRAVAYGHEAAPSHTGIKAVTYYDLDVAETPAGWQATVTFDV